MAKGSGWKLAYADLTTSLMAFFLIMWIITNKTSDEKLTIARVFRDSVDLSTNDVFEHISKENYDEQEKTTEDPVTSIENTVFNIFVHLDKITSDHIKMDYSFKDGTIKIIIIDSSEESIFKRGSDQLTIYGKRYIYDIFNALTYNADGQLLLVGHSDNIKFYNDLEDRKNFKLSFNRAMSVYDFIVKDIKYNKESIIQVSGAGSRIDYNNKYHNQTFDDNRKITILYKLREQATEEKNVDLFTSNKLFNKNNTEDLL